jgi:H+/Cl- antiporter ClcA
MVVYNVSVSDGIGISDAIAGTVTQTTFNQFYFGIFLGLFLAIIIQGFVIRLLYDIWISKTVKIKRKYLSTFLLVIILAIIFYILWTLTYQKITINLQSK